MNVLPLTLRRENDETPPHHTQARQLIRTNKIQFAVSLSLISLQELSYKQYADAAEAARGLGEIARTEWVAPPLREAATSMHTFAQGLPTVGVHRCVHAFFTRSRRRFFRLHHLSTRRVLTSPKQQAGLS